MPLREVSDTGDDLKKKEYLRARGWYSWYHEDNWISPDMSRPDYTGIPLDSAYEYVKRKEER